IRVYDSCVVTVYWCTIDENSKPLRSIYYIHSIQASAHPKTEIKR
ncbi:unnamed protein product, partial [Allacma fusca]